MAQTIRELEKIPETYPEIPISNPDLKAHPNINWVWQRIESFVCERWTPREVTYFVESDGEWTPRLTPFTITSVESFWNGEWIASDNPSNPFGGLIFLADTTHRVKCTVGADNPCPDNVLRAAGRLADYCTQLVEPITRPSGASRMEATFADGYAPKFDDNAVAIQSMSFNRDPNWQARALVQSGAADLLKNYRGLA